MNVCPFRENYINYIFLALNFGRKGENRGMLMERCYALSKNIRECNVCSTMLLQWYAVCQVLIVW